MHPTAAPLNAAPQDRERTAGDGRPLLLDARGAAALLGIGRSTFFRLDETGGVPRGVRLGGRMRRWRAEELRAWIAAGCPPRVRWEEMKK